MKKVIFIISILSCLVACKKAKQLLDITFRFTTKYDFTLPKVADQVYPVPDSLISVQTPEINNTIPDEFQKNKADINKVKEVAIESIDLTIKSPVGQTFDFMKSVEVYLGASGKGEVLVASKDNIHTLSPAPNTLSLDVKGANIVDYIKGPTYYLKIKTRLVKTYTQDIVVGSEIKFKAVANPLN